jgi:hypothetical protein
METPPGLDLEENELIPAGRDAFCRHWKRFQFTLVIAVNGSHWIQFQSAAPVLLPELIMRQGHVEDVRDTAGADHVVVIEKMTALCVRVDGHVLLRAGEGTTIGDGLEKITEGTRIEGIAEGEEIWQEGYLGRREIGQGSQIARLVHLVTE